ncbi:phosphatidate cytidylyltransferase [Microbacterium amylolyticum]|uniref:Phosphatidate cytidylyltransferase n=1 Tax=Microbacterium amylolyticum TaxID=936337 RepID=A0ABS4ZFH9_9MICO|nr:phosphatidate cytidylyltransferase [Microbacterium amylolyticum]MBP2435758.1 phosphatidate cytidylyltransferase [Microbacterium amylolyticum]
MVTDAAPEQDRSDEPSNDSLRHLDADHTASLHDRIEAARGEIGQKAQYARDQIEATNERIKNRTGRDLFAAIGVGILAGVIVLASLLFVKWVFAIVAMLIAALGVFELTRALQARGRRIDLIPQVIGSFAITGAAFWFGSAVHWAALFVSLVVIVVWRILVQMVARDGRIYASIFSDILVGCFVQLYVPLLASAALVVLRQEQGELWVISFLIVVVTADTAAYATGLTFGKTKLAPRISPGKTWEGFAGAAVVSMIAGALVTELMLGVPWWAGVIFGAVLMGTATLGDLGESMLKRDLGIKDMSSWLPGHGGVLDRLDSILPSAVVALALFHLLSPLAA